MIEIPFIMFESVFTLVWILCRAAVRVRRKRIDRKREAQLLALWAYLAALLRAAFFPRALSAGRVRPLPFDASAVLPLRINLIPFVRLADYGFRRDLLLNVAGNVAMFIPSGILLPLLDRRLDRFRKAVGAGALISLGIELLQLPFFTRTTDVDDLIQNTLGAALGFGIFALARKLTRRRTPR